MFSKKWIPLSFSEYAYKCLPWLYQHHQTKRIHVCLCGLMVSQSAQRKGNNNTKALCCSVSWCDCWSPRIGKTIELGTIRCWPHPPSSAPFSSKWSCGLHPIKTYSFSYERKSLSKLEITGGRDKFTLLLTVKLLKNGYVNTLKSQQTTCPVSFQTTI